jgi:hypothetical protein
MDWADLLKTGAEIGGLLFLVYGAGQGAKGAARWLRQRRALRHARLAEQKRQRGEP